METILKSKIYAPLGAFVLTLSFILWEYFNGGVITHHLLARQDMPGMSNWWGLLTIPLLTLLVITLINRRNKNENITVNNPKQTLRRFIAALVFGLIAGLLWEFGFANILQFYMLLPIVIAFFIPLYKPEYLLGFVLGMLFTFGGMLPILVGTVLLVICFLVYKFVQLLKHLILGKKNNLE